jgi:hypothetical protein
MPDVAKNRRDLVDAFVRLGADIRTAPGEAEAKRLRSATLSALRAQLRVKPDAAFAAGASRFAAPVSKGDRAGLMAEIEAPDEDGDESAEAVAVVRRDQREIVAGAQIVDGLSGLAAGERLGPFLTDGGTSIWFDIFFAARRTEIRQKGNSAPAMVFTKARAPVVRRSRLTVAIRPGTVWIRGDLVTGGLPATAYVGIKVSGGSLTLAQKATIAGRTVAIVAAPKGVLKLDLADDQAIPAADGCTSAGAKVDLPASLKFTFAGGTSTAKGGAGSAEAWGQSFDFDSSKGKWLFAAQLWTAVLEYDVEPLKFDSDPIADALVHFEGDGDVAAGGLGLPVVAAPDPAILGEAGQAASWLLAVTGLKARWYEPEPRLHDLGQAWIGVSAFGATVAAAKVAPLTPPVRHAYELWTVREGGGRLPWRHTYDEPFALFYRCHIVAGEHFLAQAKVDAALDRPVTTDGVPVPTPTGRGVVLLHRLGSAVTALLGAAIETGQPVHQFALRNALVWTGAPSHVFVQGALTDWVKIDSGGAQLLFGVHAWVPTLPDPYVSSGAIRSRGRRRAPSTLLLGQVSWSAPDDVTVAFSGQLDQSPAVTLRDASSGGPRPAPRRAGDPDVGPTQIEQDRLTVGGKQSAALREAQDKERRERGSRAALADQENRKSFSLIDRFLAELVGPTPALLLVDVSTNQDLLGVAVGGRQLRGDIALPAAAGFQVSELAVQSQIAAMRVVTLPQVQWEPVRTLDTDQDIEKLGWFPTPLASASDGGATSIGARSLRLAPIIPEDALQGTLAAYGDGTPVGIRTTFPFGLISAILLQPAATPTRQADLYGLTRPKFPAEQSAGGLHVTAQAEGGRAEDGGISPTFAGIVRQLINGADLASGSPLGLSVLGATAADARSNVEAIFNGDMAARPRVPVTRFDISGYGGSSFSDWNNPFAAFAETAKIQFRYMVGRTQLEVVKVTSPLLPYLIKCTRSVTIERRPGGGVIRRDSGWQPITPGLFDGRYFDPVDNKRKVAPYRYDAGVFRGLFNVRNIRPAPGNAFVDGDAALVPYYFDADLALEGVAERTPALGILGYLQAAPVGEPAAASALRALIETQGPVGGPIDTWMDFGGSGLPFHAQRIEVGLAIDGAGPIFVATVRGAPSLPTTGAWSVVVRPVANVPANGGEAVPVGENRGVPLIRRYPIRYDPNDPDAHSEPPFDPSFGPPGDYRFADAGDLLVPSAPAAEYALLQSTPTHAFLFPRPLVPTGGAPRIQSGHKPGLADIFARSTSKGAFPPAQNSIELGAGSVHFDVGGTGTLALSAPISISGHPTPLQLAGAGGHGTSLLYDDATIFMKIDHDRWEADFAGMRVWSDIQGLTKLSGAEMRVVGSTLQRALIPELKSLILEEVEQILDFIGSLANRGTQGPLDLGASNANHEFKVDVKVSVTIPPTSVAFPAGTGIKVKLFVQQSTGFDLTSGGLKASATFGASAEGKVPLLSVGVAAAYLTVSGKISFGLVSVSGAVTETLDLMVFVGVGVEGKIGPFSAYAFLGVGFTLAHDSGVTRYGGLVALEAGVDLTIVSVTIRAELKGIVHRDNGSTVCDYSGSVKIHVEIFLIFSIDASYQISDTTTF